LKHESIEKVEMYYEKLLKLANSLQTLTTANSFTTMFQSGLQSYLRIVVAGMKWKILQHHKELVLICEKDISMPEALNTLFVPQTTWTRNVIAKN
jgi:hypothetical protein